MEPGKYDIIIIGSGMGGLVCGDILSREGYKICILEKNKQIGGSLQTFARDKVVFDSGVHYIGALDKGQNLYQVFKYLGLMDKLKLQRLDIDAFDKIIMDGDDREYPFAQGYENFISKLLVEFPAEEKALRFYCDTIRDICSKFPLYNLRTGGDYSEKETVLEIDTKSFIDSITNDNRLREVLAGNNLLYAGQPAKTPLYVHALILNHYIESAWKCINGGSQIGNILAANIRSRGGMIMRNTKVERIVEENGRVAYVALAGGKRLCADRFISNIHPVKTMEITQTEAIRPIYRKRLKSLENSVSSFTLNIVFKKDCFKYFNYNYYYHKEGQTWTAATYTEANWPLGYAVFLCAEAERPYAEGMSVLAYMRFDDVKEWAHTFNTVSAKNSRGETYDEFKKRKAETLLDEMEKKFPALRNCIYSYSAATPLSYRDYLGTDDGSMYGITKNYKDPLRTFIDPRTKLPNLYLTGQNLNMHGILGVSLSAIATCVAIMGNESIIEKISHA